MLPEGENMKTKKINPIPEIFNIKTLADAL
jgi:hypothetical protein